jgi:transposase
MESPVKKNKRGKIVNSGQKVIVLNLFKKVTEENAALSKTCVVDRVASMSGVSCRSVFNILKEKKTTGVVKSPSKKRKRISTVSSIDDFTKNAIRLKVHQFFFNNEIPTLDKIVQAVNSDHDLPNLSRSAVYKLMKQLNFVYKCRNRKSILVDRDDIIRWRRKYLMDIRKFRREGRTVYYLDETWLNAGHTVTKVWMDNNVSSREEAFRSGLSVGLKNPSGKGQRLIICHIGSEKGFVEGGLLCFQSKSTKDYHEEMTGETFEKWFETISPKLDPNSVIIMDNAPYHSRKKEKIPNSSSRKQDIRKWLDEKAVCYENSMIKLELLDLVRQHKSVHDKYIVDEIASNKGLTILRLPPYHCELNPIELIWAQVKGHVARNNTTFKMADVRKLFETAINEVSAANWHDCINHIINDVEQKMFQLDHLIDDMTEPFVIDVDDGEDELDVGDEST